MMTATLIKSLQGANSDEGMRTVYRTYSSELYGFALSCLGDRGQAEEIVQDVFTRVWRHADTFDPERASFRTWLYGIARNAIIDLRRKQSVRPQFVAPGAEEDQPHFDEPLETALLRWQVQSALERLTPEHRQVIRLAHFQGLTLREIAERTGVPLGTVKSRASYALRGLRLALEEMGANP